MKRSTKAWRDFEELVARIESAAAQHSAEVKSPDFVPDKITGAMREVDATIRYTVGTVPILITVECRDRRRVQDVTWIEQLIQKRESLGAALTIAVSSRGFSAEARAKAELSSISLRELRNVSSEELDSWFRVGGFIHIFKRLRILEGPAVLFYPEDGDAAIELEIPVVEDSGPDRPMFKDSTGRSLSFNDLLTTMQNTNDPYDSLLEKNASQETDGANFPKISERIIVDWQVKVSRGDLSVEMPRGARDVASIKMLAEIWWEQERLAPINVAGFSYQGLDGTNLRRLEYQLKAGDLQLRLGLQGKLEGGGVFLEAKIGRVSDEKPED